MDKQTAGVDMVKLYKNQGKPSIEELRRKREQEGVQLRKQKREDQVSKRRNLTVSSEDSVASDELEAFLMALKESESLDLDALHALIDDVMCEDPQRQLMGTTLCRKLLAKEPSAPIEAIVRTGIVPRLVYFLGNSASELQYESAWALTNIASGSSEQTALVVDAGAIPLFLQLLSSPVIEVQEQAVWALANIAGDGPLCRDIVLDAGCVEALLSLLHNIGEVKKSLLRNCIWCISNLCRGRPSVEFAKVGPTIPVLAQVISYPDGDIMADACWALSYLSDGPNDRVQCVIDAGVSRRLVELLMNPDTRIMSAALRAVGNIATGDDVQTQALVESGVFPTLIKLLQNAEFRVRKEAAWAVSNAATGGLPEHVIYLVEEGCIPPICDLLTVAEVEVVEVALTTLENILKVGELRASKTGTPNLFAMLIEECHGLDKIDFLQQHENLRIYEAAFKIIDTYFGAVDETDIFPNGNQYANAAIVLHDQTKSIQRLKGFAQRGLETTKQDIDEMKNVLVDMLVYARRGAYTRCSVFTELWPWFDDEQLIARDYDANGYQDLSLNLCPPPRTGGCKAFSREFKLGKPTPSKTNDCSGPFWYMERAIYGASASTEAGCLTAFSSPVFRHASSTVVSHRDAEYARVSKRILPDFAEKSDTCATGSLSSKLARVENLNQDQSSVTAATSTRPIESDDAATIEDDPAEGNDETANVDEAPAENKKRDFKLREKKMIVSVHSFFEQIKLGQVVLNKIAVTKNTAAATKTSKASVRRFVQLAKEGNLESHRSGKQCVNFDNFSLAALRRKLLAFYGRKTYPTLRDLVVEINADDEFPKINKDKLSKILKRMHFRFGKVSNKKVLYEQPRIIAQRHSYLRSIRKFREAGYNIVYQDETWINAHHSRSKYWYQDVCQPGSLLSFLDVRGGLRIPSGKGMRLIINHVGGAAGFVDGAKEVFVSKTGTGDFHDAMNIDHFMDWWKTKLLPNLERKTVVVIDNAKYHNAITEESRSPTTAWRKDKIQQWLTLHNIHFEALHIKAELLHLAEMNQQPKQYLTDIAAEETGRDIKVLRLPIAHCELNPIELIWANLKGKVATRNAGPKFGIKIIEQLTNDAFDEITPENWNKAMEHVIKVENEYWEKDALIAWEVEPLVIPVDSESSDNEDDSEEDSEEMFM